jgi:hypothetical protein
VFGHIKPSCQTQEDGHALRNMKNKKSLAAAKKEIEKRLGERR